MLGAVQGVAEVVPVSSSAQLALVPELLGWEQPADRTGFAAGLHAGSCLGLAWALRDDLRRLTLPEVLVLGAVSLPAAAAGAVAADAVEQRLGRPPQLAALLAAAGALMWWVDARAERSATPRTPGTAHDAGLAVTVRPHRPCAPLTVTPDSRRATGTTSADPVRPADAMRPAGSGVPPRAAAAAALAQVVALVPGVSRSGAALTALRACGVDRASAERFSLLMSLPITAGAAALTLARADRAALHDLGPGLAAGVPSAAAAAALTATRRRAHPGRPLTGAAVYRLALAAAVAVRLSRKGAQ
ncbi:MAG: undecaprenyl-diphosphate phosphatase [Candidatus Limnocylindrales bacterium]